MAEKLPGWFRQGLERFLSADIREIKADLKVVDSKITNLEKVITAEPKRLDEKIDTRFESLEKRLDLVQQVAVLQAKVRELEERLAARS